MTYYVSGGIRHSLLYSLTLSQPIITG